MAHQDFDAAVREAEREEVAFTVAGERFECDREGRVGPLFRLGQTGTLTIRNCRQFLIDVTADADRERLDKTLDHVSLDTLTGIVDWLVGVYTGRPTLPSTGSPDGRPSTGGTSTPASAAPGQAG